MKSEATTFFNELCEKVDIQTTKSNLASDLYLMDEFDLWKLLQEHKIDLGAPIICMEVGTSYVLHFHIIEKRIDVYIEILPRDKTDFCQHLGEYTKHAS